MTPAALGSTSNAASPSGVLASTSRTLAFWPCRTKLATPSSVAASPVGVVASPVGVAVIATPSGVHFPVSPVRRRPKSIESREAPYPGISLREIPARCDPS